MAVEYGYQLQCIVRMYVHSDTPELYIYTNRIVWG